MGIGFWILPTSDEKCYMYRFCGSYDDDMLTLSIRYGFGYFLRYLLNVVLVTAMMEGSVVSMRLLTIMFTASL